MKRWQVQRGPVRHKGRTYLPGEYMPENFTERDRARNVYSRRLVLVDIPDEPSALPTPGAIETPAVKQEATTVETAERIKPATTTDTIQQEEVPKIQAKPTGIKPSTGTIRPKTK